MAATNYDNDGKSYGTKRSVRAGEETPVPMGLRLTLARVLEFDRLPSQWLWSCYHDSRGYAHDADDPYCQYLAGSFPDEYRLHDFARGQEIRSDQSVQGAAWSITHSAIPPPPPEQGSLDDKVAKVGDAPRQQFVLTR